MSDMINALDELHSINEQVDSLIIAAKVSFRSMHISEDHVLYPDHSREEYELFERFLDRNYDSGYGSQCLFGTLWFADGSWATRGEYDGSEWWTINKLPKLPVKGE